RDDNPLHNAPHPAADLIGEWERPYPARLAAYPLEELEQDKYWPPIGRLDAAGGDHNIVCTYPPLDTYMRGITVKFGSSSADDALRRVGSVRTAGRKGVSCGITAGSESRRRREPISTPTSRCRTPMSA